MWWKFNIRQKRKRFWIFDFGRFEGRCESKPKANVEIWNIQRSIALWHSKKTSGCHRRKTGRQQGKCISRRKMRTWFTMKIDIVSMQEAVVKGYKVLCKIWVEYGDRPLPKNIRWLANACLAGGIAWDTFPGRKQTSEDLLWDYVTESLKNGEYFLLTWSTMKRIGEKMYLSWNRMVSI